MNNFIELWCILGSGGFTIFVASTSFLKRNIGWWPQQPPTSNRYHWKIEFFIDPFQKRGLVLVFLVLRMIQPSQWVNYLMNWGCWCHWGHWNYWGCRGHRDYGDSYTWKITTEDIRVIQLLQFSSTFRFWKQKFSVESWIIYHSWLLAPFLSEAV